MQERTIIQAFKSHISDQSLGDVFTYNVSNYKDKIGEYLTMVGLVDDDSIMKKDNDDENALLCDVVLHFIAQSLPKYMLRKKKKRLSRKNITTESLQMDADNIDDWSYEQNFRKFC